ncbi:AMP-binding protein [Aliivibrio sp. S2TY2]|nr:MULTISPECIES: AMP-binding protein [Aliivibrio]MDD9173326.1 AMP-binding protein [Aliivibrio sp. S3TY1]MDD9190402.1 AMP-binding protein [Aliivibrio sp. S2TY2]
MDKEKRSMSYTALSDLTNQENLTHHVCFDEQHTYVSYQQFQHDVQRVCGYLSHQSEVKWALCFDDSYQFAVSFLALAHAGKHIILPGNHQPAALTELSEHFDALLHDDIIQVMPCEHHRHYQTISDNVMSVLSPLELGNIRLTLFTSGSTDTPKPIEKTLQLLSNEIEQLEQLWGDKLDATEIYSTVSHQHIYGLLFRVLWPLCAGRAFSRTNFIYPEQILSHQPEHKKTLICSPALLKRLADHEGYNHYQMVFSSGGPLAIEGADQSEAKLSLRPFEVYGSTETGGVGYRQQIEPTSLWTFFPSHKARLNIEHCLELLSPFIDESQWYPTSDYCDLLDNGQFMLKGRVDRVIKIEEKRLSLTEVEKRLMQLEWIDEAAVIPMEEAKRTVLGAVIVLSDTGNKLIQQGSKGKFWLKLRSELREWLEPVGIPRRFRAVEEIPLNSQGKRQMHDLQQLFNDVND